MSATILRSTLLAFSAKQALPAFDELALRDAGSGPVKVWIDADGFACCLMLPGQTEADFSNDGALGEWVAVTLDEPANDESEAATAAREWLARFLAKTP